MVKTTLLAAGLLALSPAAAAAAERHVTLTGTDNPTCQAGTPCRTVAHAVAVAAAGDTVRIGSGNFAGPVTVTKPLTLEGAGSEATTIERPAGGGALSLQESATVRGLRVVAGDGNAVYIPSIVLARTITLDDVAAHAPTVGDRAIDVRSATGPLTLTITGGEFTGDYGVWLGRGTATVSGTRVSSTEFGLFVGEEASAELTDTRVAGRIGAQTLGGTIIARRSRFAGSHGAVDIHSSEMAAGTLTFVDSVATTPSAYWAIRLDSIYAGRSAVAQLDRSTVVAPGAPGVWVRANGGLASATLRNTIVVGGESDLVASGTDAAITARSSAFAVSEAAGGATVPAVGTNGNLPGEPGLAADLSPAPGSPLIDAGDPADIAAGTLDLDGNPRVSDGDGDGVARPDIGAIERPGVPPAAQPPAAPPAPAATTDTTAPRLGVRADRRGRLRVSLSEPAALRVTARRMRAGRRKGKRCVAPANAPSGPRCMRLGKRFAVRTTGTTVLTTALRRGRYRVTVVATDAAGNRSDPAKVTVRR